MNLQRSRNESLFWERAHPMSADVTGGWTFDLTPKNGQSPQTKIARQLIQSDINNTDLF